MKPTSPAALRRIPLLAALLLLGPGCASQRERVALADWSALGATFSPMTAGGEAPTLPAAPTLADYVRLTLRRNRSLQAQAHRWRAALDEIPQVRSLPDPLLMYGGYIEEVETRVGPQRHALAVSQRVPWPGKLLTAADLAFEESEAARARIDAVRRDVVHELTAAYARYYVLAREVAITAENLTLLRHWEQVAQTRFRAGARAAHRDVIKAQLEIGLLEDRLASLRDARRPLVGALRALLDLPPGVELPWPTELPEARLALDEAGVLTVLTRDNPLLAALDREVAAREEGVSLARQSYLPDFMLGLDYIEVGPARASGVSGSGQDALIGRFGLTLPIWWGRYAAEVDAARARLRAAELSRAQTENDLVARAEQALYDYRDAERKVRLYEGSLIPKAEESLRAGVTAWETGAGDFLDVLDTERMLLELHLSRERARAERLRALSDLERLSGADLAPPHVTHEEVQ